MLTVTRKKIFGLLARPVHAAPLAVFRMLFGGVMLASMLRFWWKGWVDALYIRPQFFFPFYGFEWVKPLGQIGTYTVFGLVTVSALLMMLGLFYRPAAWSFFLGFSYIELIDKSNYLNHYYFISVVSFLLALLPAHRYFSLDIWRTPSQEVTEVPWWMIGAFQVQLGMVYFFAGLAKLNYDWLVAAMPLRIWLPPHSSLPWIGPLMDETWLAYLFSWFGAIYDLTVVYFLLRRRTRPLAYLLVIAFHLMTAWLFPIGMFPFIMILLTLVYFPEEFHRKLLHGLRTLVSPFTSHSFNAGLNGLDGKVVPIPRNHTLLLTVLTVHFIVQLMMPFRYLLYPGNLFWTEQGYRFSWRVMLMEKAGTAFFYVTEPVTGKREEVDNSDFLTPNQEKMMATQPDMILQFSHFLEDHYLRKGIVDPIVTVESYVTLNGSGSRPFLDSTVDLTKESEGFAPKKWILNFDSPQ